MRALSLLLCIFAVASADPIIRALPELQVASGGFHEIGTDVPDVFATSSALFLSALYGQTTQINADDAAQFVQGLQSATDSGYGQAIGLPSSIEATRAALTSYLHLGRDIPNADQTGEYIRSLFNVNNGLFASQAGGEGDLKATALAVESLEILGELKKPVVQEMLKRTKDLLQERTINSGDSSRFVLDPESQTQISDNYYGIFLAHHSGFLFENSGKWAKYILSLQDLDDLSATFGGFYESEAKTVVSAAATANAARSLALLGEDIGATRSAALLQYTQSRKFSVIDTASSHWALAHTNLFKTLFQIRMFYDPVDDSTSEFVQGVRVTPIVRVTVFENTVVHGGFSITVQEQLGWSAQIPFDSTTNHYIATSQLDTKDRLGEVNFSYDISSNVYPIGEIQFTHQDTKRVGYRVAVDESATFGDRELEADESVLPGTNFVFKVSLSTLSEDEILSGDFKLVFSVRDASNVVQHSETLDGSKNLKAITFAYSLTGFDFPSGAVQFVFEVENENGVHTTRRNVRAFEQQMVSSHVTVSTNNQLGSTLTVTMQPSSLRDLHTIAPFAGKNAASRSFVMDVISSQGTVVLTLPGVVIEAEENASYKFETTIPASLDLVGENFVTFRFVPASVDLAFRSLKLSPFDTEANELLEESSAKSFSVEAELHLNEIEAEPKDKEFTYGSTIPLKFKIQDALSRKTIVAGKLSSVYVSLTNRDGTFESSRVVAIPEKDVFEVSVQIDANTLAGDASIVISGVSVDDTEVPILAPGSKNKAKYDVKVGGSIDVTSNTFSTASADSTKSALVVTFALSCAEKPLHNARLFATLLRNTGTGFVPVQMGGESVSHVTVAKDTSAAGTGSRYSFSVVLPHQEASSGQYKIEFRRAVDLERSASDDSQVKPLFEIALAHKEVESGGFFVRMEFVSLLILGALFLGINSHRVLFDSKKLL